MKPRMDVLVTAFVLTLSLLVSARAQQGGGRVTAPAGTYGRTLDQAPRPMYLRGKVLFDDGNPASGATVELACNSGVQRQVFASADGSYSLDISARENSTFSDASMRGSGGRGDIVSNSPTRTSLDQMLDLSSCELRAAIAGFQSSRVSLGRRRPLDNSEVNPIVLSRLANVKGSTVSLTTAKAPKKARKSFEKANKELGKKKVKYSKVARELEKAVKDYPRFAAAWHQLGEARLRLGKEAEARDAFQQSIEADSTFISPVMSLVVLEANGNRWQEVSKLTDRVLELNPYLTSVHFYRAIAHFGLGRTDSAEQSIQSLRKGGQAENFPANYYVMGAILASRGNLPVAVTEFRKFLEVSPESPFAVRVRQQMDSWEKQGLMKSANPPQKAEDRSELKQ